ncbi:MAG TPA: hypothetical protein VN442_21075 [Bryobacteraceae bacterium]|nr:hypothetical protein [Bryobacteraceae bacterium]
MFRSLKGFKAQYDDVTVFVAADFDEYRVLLQAPGTIVQGRRQFNEAQAKEHARTLAADYLKERLGTDTALQSLDWIPFGQLDWLAWNP